MRKIIIVLLLVILVQSVYSIKTSTIIIRRYGNTVIGIERFKDEPSGVYKIIKTKKYGEVTNMILFYRNNPDYVKKSVQIIKNENIYSTEEYYEKNNPNYSIFSLVKDTGNKYIMTTQHENAPSGLFKSITHFGLSKESLFAEYFFKDNSQGKIKEFHYYENGKVAKVKYYYKKNKQHMVSGITYYIPSGGRIRDWEEEYYEKDPDGLEKILIYYEDGKRIRMEQYFDSEKQPDNARQLIMYYYNGLQIKEEQFFDKPYKGLAYKLEKFYINGKFYKIIGYDKDGNVTP